MAARDADGAARAVSAAADGLGGDNAILVAYHPASGRIAAEKRIEPREDFARETEQFECVRQRLEQRRDCRIFTPQQREGAPPEHFRQMWDQTAKHVPIAAGVQFAQAPAFGRYGVERIAQRIDVAPRHAGKSLMHNLLRFCSKAGGDRVWAWQALALRRHMHGIGAGQDLDEVELAQQAHADREPERCLCPVCGDEADACRGAALGVTRQQGHDPVAAKAQSLFVLGGRRLRPVVHQGADEFCARAAPGTDQPGSRRLLHRLDDRKQLIGDASHLDAQRAVLCAQHHAALIEPLE